MTRWRFRVVVSGLWLVQTACGGIGSSMNEELSPDGKKPISGIEQQSDAFACVDRVMERLGIDLGQKTDPALLSKILNEDMLLGDFAPVQALFAKSLSAPQPLRPMLEATREAIVSKQPAINAFLCAALDEKLIPAVEDEKSAGILKKALHHSYLLDGLTEQIVDNARFMVDIQAHLLKKRAAFGIRGDLVGALEDLKKLYSGRMFEPTKIVSMDLVYTARAKIRERGNITADEIKGQANGLKLNILEAAVTDNAAGFGDNAMAGAALSAIPPETITLTPDTRALLFHLSRKWASLYESWNLSFITGNLTHLQILYPKLLIPAVIGAESEDYLFHRSCALWLSTLFHQFAMLNRKPDAPIPNKQALAKLFSQINRTFGEEIAGEELGRDLEELRPALGITLGQIIEQMKKALSAVSLSPEDQARLAELYAD